MTHGIAVAIRRICGLRDLAVRVAKLSASSVAPAGHVSELLLGPPIPDPGKVPCIRLNYSDHVEETGRKVPEHPDVFAKFASTLIGQETVIDCS